MVVVSFSKGKGESGTYLAFVDPNGNATLDSGETTVASGHVSKNTELITSSFDPNGTGSLTATITLGPSGITSICTGS